MDSPPALHHIQFVAFLFCLGCSQLYLFYICESVLFFVLSAATLIWLDLESANGKENIKLTAAIIKETAYSAYPTKQMCINTQMTAYHSSHRIVTQNADYRCNSYDLTTQIYLQLVNKWACHLHNGNLV